MMCQRSNKHPSGWSTEPWLVCLGMRSLRHAKPRAGPAEGQMLPEQISLHSHCGHDFNLDLEGLYSRSQFIPHAQPEGQGTLQKGHSKPLRGAVGDTGIAYLCHSFLALPSIPLGSSSQAESTAGHTHPAVSSASTAGEMKEQESCKQANSSISLGPCQVRFSSS